MFRMVADQSQIERDGMNPFEYLGWYAKQPGNTMRGLKELSPNPNFLSGLSDEKLDMSVDNFIDDYMLVHAEMLREKYRGKPNTIIILDSRIAALLMKRQGKDIMAVRFSVQPEIAAERLVKRAKTEKGEIDIEGLSPEEAYQVAFNSHVTRKDGERNRFISGYTRPDATPEEMAEVDLQNLDNYDLVINTSGTTIPREVEVLYSCIEKARRGKEYDKFWRSTKFIYPGSLIKEDIDPSKEPRVCAIKIGDQYYALHGQEYVGIANHKGYMVEQQTGEENGYPLIPVDVVKKRYFIRAVNKEGVLTGAQADEYIKRNITQNVVANFERDYGFKYPNRGVAKLKSVEEVRSESRRNVGPDWA